MAKLTTNQLNKIQLINKYFKTVKNHIKIGENNVLNGNTINQMFIVIDNVWVHYRDKNKGILMAAKIYDHTNIKHLYKCALKNDNSFKFFIKNQ